MRFTLIGVFLVILVSFLVESRLMYKGENIKGSPSVLVDCIKALTSRASLISEELEGNYLATEIIKHMQTSITLERLNGKKYQIHYIVFSSSLHFYKTFLNGTSMEDQLSLIVVWQMTNEENVTAVMQDIFSEVWKHETYRILILNEEESSDINVYTFLPYSTQKCDAAGPPEHIDTWSSKNKGFTKGTALTHLKRFLLKNLHGCPLKCMVKNHPPETIVTTLKNGSLNLQGGGGAILSSLMKRYNFTITVQMEDFVSKNIRDKHGYKISRATKNSFQIALATKSFDLAFGVFLYLTHFSPDIDFTEQCLSETYTFYVPCGTKGGPSMWKNYYLEFSSLTWIIMGFLVFFFSVSFKFITFIFNNGEKFELSSFWCNIFNLFAVHVENPVKMNTCISTLRFCWILILFYCTILSVAYKASLKSFLMAPWEAGCIETWEELEKSDMTITGLPTSFSILDVVRKNDSVLGNIAKRFEIKTSGEFSEFVEAVTVKRNTAYFGSESMIMFYNSKKNEENGTFKQTICQIKRIVASSPASLFLLRKGSPFQNLIKRVTADHVHGGLNENLLYKAVTTKKNYEIKREEKKYSLHQLEGVFIMWIIGLFLSIFAFIFEILWSTYNNRHLNFK